MRARAPVRPWSLFLVSLSVCGSCNKGDASSSSPSSDAGNAPAVAEVLPRCRGEAQRLAFAGEDVVIGDVAVGSSGLLLGVIRLEGGKRLASVMRTSLDLGTSKMIEVGTPLGDDPPPSPRWNGSNAWVAFFARRSSDAGAKVRELDVARIDESGAPKVEATIVQQADESTAFDVAWTDSGAGLAAWDEDAPLTSDGGARPSTVPFEARGFVKVQALGSSTRRVASPESSDAESPRLLPRPSGGFWLAWLARRAEEEAYAVEGPGEKRAFRWVEVVPLTATGEPAGPVRRVSPEKGRAASFELGRSGNDLVVIVQDEAAPAEGAGGRIVRYLVADKIEAADIIDGGVGSALAELVPATNTQDNGARWLAWNDLTERTHITPLGPGLVASGHATSEPALDGARVLATVPPDAVYALVFTPPSDGERGKEHRPEIRRFACPQITTAARGN